MNDQGEVTAESLARKAFSPGGPTFAEGKRGPNKADTSNGLELIKMAFLYNI